MEKSAVLFTVQFFHALTSMHTSAIKVHVNKILNGAYRHAGFIIIAVFNCMSYNYLSNTLSGSYVILAE